MSLHPARIYLLTATGDKFYPEDPVRIEEALTAHRLPVSFVGKANGFLANIDDGGVGYLLLKRSDLNRINQEVHTHSLVFEVDGVAQTTGVTISNLHIAGATAVAGTHNEGLLDVYLVELRDRWRLAKFSSINKSYNIRTPDWVSTSTFFVNSTNGGTPWTWATMVADIWTNISGVTGSTLTTTLADYPTHNPDNFCFAGGSAFEALRYVASSTNHHLFVNRSGTFNLVSEGDGDAANTALFTSYRTWALNPSHPQDSNGTRVPEYVRVFFPRRNPAFQVNTDPAVLTGTDQWHQNPTYSLDRFYEDWVSTDTFVSGAIWPIYDSMTALYDETGNLLNGLSLSDQADKRAQEYYESAVQTDCRNDLFKRAVPFELGAKIKKVHWYDFGDGIRTQVFTFPKKIDDSSLMAEWPAMPDLSRWHLPYERWAVGTVYNADIVPDGSGIVRVLYGTQTSSTVTTWAQTALPHEIRAHDIYHRCYKDGDRVFCGYLRQSSRWVIVGAETDLPKYGEATLVYDLCSTSNATITGFEPWIDHVPCGTIGEPTSAQNPFNHKGKAGDTVLVLWSNYRGAFVIIDVEKHNHKVYTNLRKTGSCEHWCIEGYAVTAALEVCSDPAWETVYCDPCTIDGPSQSSLQTSTGYTSVPAYGCCVDYVNVAEHNIETVDLNGDSVPITDDQPIYLTITQDDDPVVYDDPNPLNYDIEIISPRTADINAPLVYPASGPIRSAQLTHPNDPGPYPVPSWESWVIRCIRRVDPLTGVLLFPNDPSQREWVIDGMWGLAESHTGATPQGMMRIFESGVAIYYPAGNNPSSNKFLVTGGVTVHSCDPFHATAHFDIPDSLTAENGNTFESRYPYGPINAGPTSLEFTE